MGGMHYGFMGSSPDHSRPRWSANAWDWTFSKRGGDRATALIDYFDYASNNDLFLTYVIINPQANRAKAWGEQDEDLVARIVDEDSRGSRSAAPR